MSELTDRQIGRLFIGRAKGIIYQTEETNLKNGLTQWRDMNKGEEFYKTRNYKSKDLFIRIESGDVRTNIEVLSFEISKKLKENGKVTLMLINQHF